MPTDETDPAPPDEAAEALPEAPAEEARPALALAPEVPPREAVGPGAEVAGARLIRPVHVGALGTLWLGESLSNAASLAVRVFPSEIEDSAAPLDRFERRLLALRQLSADRSAPPSVLRLSAVAPDGLAFATPYLPGGTLETLADRAWTLEQKRAAFLSICHAVAFAHRVGVAHGEIAPGDVLLDGDGRPVLTGFQQPAGPAVDEPAEVAALGRLLRFLLSERHAGAPDEAVHLRDFPRGVLGVVRRATRADPRRRTPDVPTLIQEVETWDRPGAALRARRDALVDGARANWPGLALGALVLAVVGAGAGWQAREADALRATIAQLNALAEQRDAAGEHARTLAAQIRALTAEQEALAVQRDALPEGDPTRAALQAQIDGHGLDLARRQEEQRHELASVETLKQRLREAQPPAPAPAPCAGPSQGGPSGLTRTALDGDMRFVGLQAGRFCMGSPPGEGSSDEHPQHAVHVSAFWLGQSEVTQAQWRAVVLASAARGDETVLKEAPSRFTGDTLPVERVSWCDAARFANALSRQEGLGEAYFLNEDCEKGGDVRWDRKATGYRLPTEAEWEYAARAGEAAPDLAAEGWTDETSGARSHPVCTAETQPWTLCDLHGNVWEWAWDLYQDRYTEGEATDPEGPRHGDHRVQRGGSWLNPAEDARSASRHWDIPSSTWFYSGFRLAISDAPEPKP